MPAARLQKCARLLKAAEFNRVFDKSVRSSDRYFTVLARHNTLTHPRLGLAISKRKAKLAVQRNRLKRIVRETFRCSTVIANADYVVMAGQQSATATNTALFQSLDKHWRILKQKCESSC
jgi:ribonuclease P protein component